MPTPRETVRSIDRREQENQWQTFESAQRIIGAGPGPTGAGGSETHLRAAPRCSEPGGETVHMGTHMHAHVHCYQLTVVFLLIHFVLCFTKRLQFIGTTVANLA